jgi:hypothetical protein
MAMTGIVTASLLPERAPGRRHDEDDFQRDVCQYLRWSLPSDAEYYAVPNGGKRHSKAAARLVGQGVRAGLPDLCVVYRGSTIFIELKTARGVLSEAQRQMHRKLGYCGCTVLVCRTLACVESSLRELGVPLRGSVA